MAGSDAADQDGLFPSWKPFNISNELYEEIKEWWLEGNPNAECVELDLSSDNYNNWFGLALISLDP